MLLDDVVQCSLAVAATRSRNAKVERLAALLAGTPPEALLRVTAWLGGALPQGKIGVGPATLFRDAPPPPASRPALSVDDVDRA
ncbi:MAG: ATP-dependent DNA ligase, partial [Deltaproteobacteria bacterium]